MHAYRSVTNKRTDINGDDKKSSPIKFPNEKKGLTFTALLKSALPNVKELDLKDLTLT
jgi:hypothetical protein